MPAADEKRVDSDLLRRYRRIRAVMPQAANIALLRVGARDLQLLIGRDDHPQTHYRLAMGPYTIAHEHLRHTPALPREIENAIFAIEEQIEAAHIAVPAGTQLYSTDPIVQRIAHLSHAQGDGLLLLGTDSVERSFNRLVNVAHGKPATHESLALDSELSATLLLLRELLHHLQFASVTVFA